MREEEELFEIIDGFFVSGKAFSNVNVLFN